MNNTFGIIGGMGPMASAVFYKMLTEMTPAKQDQDHLNLILLSDSDMPDRTSAIKAGENSAGAAEVRKKLLEDALLLEKAGCKGYCLTCNTAHYFMHALESQVGIPLISMIRESAKELSKRFPKGKVAILATDGTISSELYQSALSELGVTPVILSPEGRAATMELIYRCIKAGKPADEKLIRLIDKEVHDKGCNAALLACTELSVIKEDGLFGEFYIDAMAILAQRVIEFMTSFSEI